jgi:hypothetical protein
MAAEKGEGARRGADRGLKTERAVARKTRLAGLALLLIGLALAAVSKRAADPAMWRLGAILAIAAGGGLMILAMARRTLDQRLRMDAEQGPGA